jgi:hypothetical protein
MGREEEQKEFPWENFREGDQLEDLDVGKRILIKWIYKNLNWGHGLD